jgi:ATP-dependent DNA helicase DinG
MIGEWAAATETGDRAEIEDLPEDSPLWNDLGASSETCLGTGCPRYEDCFVTRMRRRAAEADVVIVNHHLLCADAAVRQSAYGEVIPECGVAILDEAHQLEDVATRYFGISVSSYRVDELVRDGERLLAAGAIADGCVAAELAGRLADLRDRAAELFRTIVRTRTPAGPLQDEGGERVRLSPAMLQALADAGGRTAAALDALAGTVALVREAPESLGSLARRAAEMGDELQFLLRANDPGFVYYVERRGRGLFLCASPIDVSAIVRDLLLDRMRTTVLTSATLAINSSFDYLRGRLGIRHASEVQLASEFDYARQAILYLPPRMPDPRAAGFGEAAAVEIGEILKRTRGRAFVLFTSYATLNEVHARLRRALAYPLLIQGTAPRPVLLREFRTTPGAVLLATSSFWQGVDVAGEALSCVIIDKLPFASPADPVTAARIDAIARRGGEPFYEYQVPLATLALLQGLGRLVRHRRDRGVLAILDPRLRTRAYGRRFLAALPPAPVTTDLDRIGRFLDDEAGVPA